MHRKCGPLALVLLAFAVGCQKQVYMCDAEVQNAERLLPSHLENDPGLAAKVIFDPAAAPADVNCPDRPPRPITLQECIAIALENGNTSSRNAANINGQGLVDDQLAQGLSSQGLMATQGENVRVLSYNPAAQYTDIEAQLSRFDAIYSASINWNTTDALQQGLSSFQNGMRAQFQNSVVKAFASGGVGNLSFITDYQYLSSPPPNFGAGAVPNPLYTTRLQFGFEQPLWRDYGTEINQLLQVFPSITGATMPGAAAAAFNSRGPAVRGEQSEGILITRLLFDQSRAEFERKIHALTLNVMVAYWRLYQAYGSLYSFEEVMRLSHKAWMVSFAKFQAGAEGGPAEYYPVRAQFEEFRGERMRALGQVIEAERNLRGILGMPVEDGCRLVPITPPTLAPFRPDWCASLQDAITLRPELVLARDNVRFHQMRVLRQQNFLKPDLRFVGNYTPVGFGTTIEGNEQFQDGTGTSRPRNSFDSLSSLHFNDWSVGLQFATPLGYRLDHSLMRSFRLELAQSHQFLKEQEQKTERILAQQYQKLQEWHNLIEARQAERKAYAEAVNARIKQVIAGQITPGDLGLLDFQRRLAGAQVKEYEAIAEYNNTIARLEWAKGTVLQHTNVIIGEGPLPECTQVRAVEHERRRSESLILKVRPAPLTHPARLAGDISDLPPTLPLPGQPQSSEQLPAPSAAPPAKQADEKVEVLPKPRPETLPVGPGKTAPPQLPPNTIPPAVEDNFGAAPDARPLPTTPTSTAPPTPDSTTPLPTGEPELMPSPPMLTPTNPPTENLPDLPPVPTVDG